MSYNINLQHIVFRTNRSEPTISNEKKVVLLAYIVKVSKDMKVNIIRINSYLNHIHILADIPVTLTIPEYVRKIKQTSSVIFFRHIDFPNFCGWAVGYGSFSVSYHDKNTIVNYIKNQEEHHRRISFAEELEKLFGKDFIKSDPYWKKNWIE